MKKNVKKKIRQRKCILAESTLTARLQPSYVSKKKKKERKCPNTVILKDLYELFCSFLTSVYLKVQASCGYKIFMDKIGIDR